MSTRRSPIFVISATDCFKSRFWIDHDTPRERSSARNEDFRNKDALIRLAEDNGKRTFDWHGVLLAFSSEVGAGSLLARRGETSAFFKSAMSCSKQPRRFLDQSALGFRQARPRPSAPNRSARSRPASNSPRALSATTWPVMSISFALRRSRGSLVPPTVTHHQSELSAVGNRRLRPHFC